VKPQLTTGVILDNKGEIIKCLAITEAALKSDKN
jgi:hypothetical protein